MSKTLQGKMSTFGGLHDTGVGPNEGLALVNSDSDFQKLKEYFLEAQPRTRRAMRAGWIRKYSTSPVAGSISKRRFTICKTFWCA